MHILMDVGVIMETAAEESKAELDIFWKRFA